MTERSHVMDASGIERLIERFGEGSRVVVSDSTRPGVFVEVNSFDGDPDDLASSLAASLKENR